MSVPFGTCPDPNRELILDGTLQKFGGPLNRWKKRYVRLDIDGNISWYESNTAPLSVQFKGCYNLKVGARYRNGEPNEFKGEEQFTFVLSVPVTEKLLILATETDEERTKWISAIKKFAAQWNIKQTAKERAIQSKHINDARFDALSRMGLIDEKPKKSSASSASAGSSAGSSAVNEEQKLQEELKSVEREGYLNKQSAILKQWRRRYFVLTAQGKLIYFKKSSKKLGEKMGFRDIKKSTIQIITDEDSGSYGFSLTIEGTTDLLMADTEQERDAWVITLAKFGSAPQDIRKYLNYAPAANETAATPAAASSASSSSSGQVAQVAAAHIPAAPLSSLGNNVEASDLELSPILTNQGNESWLNKLSKHVKTWKKRYFRLTDDGKLEYYTSKQKKLEDRKGVLDIKDSVIRYGEINESNKTPHTFVVSIGSRLVHLQAKNEVEQRAWVQALSKFGEGPREVDMTKMSSKAIKVMQQQNANAKETPAHTRESSLSGKAGDSGAASTTGAPSGNSSLSLSVADDGDLLVTPLVSPTAHRESSAGASGSAAKGKSKLAAMLGESKLPTQDEVQAEIAAKQQAELNEKLQSRGIDPDSMQGEKGRSMILMGTGRESYLLKRSDVFGIWKERYTVLTVDGKLNFYNNHASRSLEPRLSLDIRGCIVRCLEVCIDTDREFAFEVISPTRRISLAASSERERSLWCMAIGEHGDFDNAGTSGSSTPAPAKSKRNSHSEKKGAPSEPDSPVEPAPESSGRASVVKGKSSFFSVFTGKDKANPAEEKPERHGSAFLQTNENHPIAWPRYIALYHDTLVYFQNSNSPVAIGEIVLGNPAVHIFKLNKTRVFASTAITEEKFNPETDLERAKNRSLYGICIANYNATDESVAPPSNGSKYVFAFETMSDCDEWLNSLIKIQKKAKTAVEKELKASGGTAKPPAFHQYFTNCHYGWLNKLGGLMKNKWTNRFFVVQQHIVTTWKDEESAGIVSRINGAVPHVIINLLGSSTSKTSFDGVEFGFTLASKADKNDGTARSYQLHTDSIDSLLKWVAVLNAGNNLDRLALDSANREKQQKKEHSYFVHRKSEQSSPAQPAVPAKKDPARGTVAFPKIKKKDEGGADSSAAGEDSAESSPAAQAADEASPAPSITVSVSEAASPKPAQSPSASEPSSASAVDCQPASPTPAPAPFVPQRISIEPGLTPLPNFSPSKPVASRTSSASVSIASPHASSSSGSLSVASPPRGRAASSLAPPASAPDLEPTAESGSLPPGHPEAPTINSLVYDKFQSQLLWSDNGSAEKGNAAASFTIIIRDMNTNQILGKPAVATQSPLSFKLHTLILNANAMGHIIQVSVQALNNLNGGSVSAKSNLMQFTAGSFGTFYLGDPLHDMSAPGAVAVPPSIASPGRVSVSTAISPLLARQIRGVSNSGSSLSVHGASPELLAAFAKKSLVIPESSAPPSQQ